MPYHTNKTTFTPDKFKYFMKITRPRNKIFNTTRNKFTICWLECKISKLSLFCNIKSCCAIIFATFYQNKFRTFMRIKFLWKYKLFLCKSKRITYIHLIVDAWTIENSSKLMTSLVQNWVLIFDTNNMSSSRFLKYSSRRLRMTASNKDQL